MKTFIRMIQETYTVYEVVETLRDSDAPYAFKDPGRPTRIQDGPPKVVVIEEPRELSPTEKLLFKWPGIDPTMGDGSSPV